MQAIQIVSEGLRREFQVVVPAAELETRLTTELTGLKNKVRINGFRPGKVPITHLRRLYGRAVMADVVQSTVNEANQKIVGDNKFRLALEPQVKLPEDKAAIEAVMEAKADLAYTVALEVLPSFALADLSGIELSREMADISESLVDSAIERLAKQNRAFTPKEDGAAERDRVTIDFVGAIDGETFQGGTGEDVEVEIGSGAFLPGFEEQLVGAKAGDTRTIAATFPADYADPKLAGKPAEFAVTVKAVDAVGETKIDDELGKAYGREGLDSLREVLRERIGLDFAAQSRRKLKKALLDALDKLYTFDLPQSLVDQEFANVWAQLEAEMKEAEQSFDDETTTEEQARKDYHRLAERRVRLGLVLAEIGDKADIKISDEEINDAMFERVRQFPGQERSVWEYFSKNPQARAELRAPIFEDKVIDHLLGQVKLEEKNVSREELFANDEDKTSPEVNKTSAANDEDKTSAATEQPPEPA